MGILNRTFLAFALCTAPLWHVEAQELHRPPTVTAAVAPRPTANRPPRVPAVRWFADHPRQYVLVEPFKYQPGRGGEPITVPAGFVTDFASIPGALQPLFGPSVHDLPALVHDYLYWRHSCTRDQADDIFFRALDEFGVSTGRIILIHAGLAVGGYFAYRENARDRQQKLPRIIPESDREIPVITWEEFRKELRRRGTGLDAPDPKPPAYCGSA